MRNYGKITPQFWMGKTGRALRREGASAQLVALYLITSPHANLIGLYYLPLSYIAHDTGLSLEEVQRGLQGCVASGMCRYDEDSGMVWVIEMARFQVAESLSGRDKRITSVQEAYQQLPPNPFLPAFYERYGEVLLMAFGRTADGDRMPFGSPSQGHAIPIGSTSEGLRSQEQEQEQEQDQDQDQDQGQRAKQEREQGAMRDGIAAPTLSPSLSPRPDAVQNSGEASAQAFAKKTPLPDNFGISPAVRQWANERQITRLELHLEHFISKVRRSGYTYVDWDEALKVAIQKDWADLGKHQPADANAEPASRLGKAGRATANNARRWLEEADVD